MKVVSAQTMAALEAKAYRQGSRDEDFMEEAGKGIVAVVQDFINEHQLSKNVLLLCGKGNNGGDTFVAGVFLLQAGYNVSAIQPEPLELGSPLCQKNAKRFIAEGGNLFDRAHDYHNYSLIVDGLFGTGFKGQIAEPYTSLVLSANKSGLPILAVDIPSGLNGSTGEASGTTIRATETLFLGLPKIGFFLDNGWNYVGKLRYIDFGLPSSLVEEVPAEYELLSKEQMAKLIPPTIRNRNKYSRGYVVGLAGSHNMPGAAIMASFAALKGGCGIVRLLHPDGMQAELAGAPYELIKMPYRQDQFHDVLNTMEKASAIFIGPGMGVTDENGKLLHNLIPHLMHPCVVDADALTLYAKGMFKTPLQAIFTPHLGEMKRLLKYQDFSHVSVDILKVCQKYVEERNITLILKGAPTFIFHPHKPIQINPTGDPAMATAGSGDVLTGLVASLCAQGLSTHDAACLGVYFHGLAGEFAALEKTSHSVIATDLIDQFPQVFKQF